uniref:Threonine synthase-like 2 n=1 Tax=Phallusia mammillata TaxID=59560 RepID=A0A6F9DU30_9ASCI|nr:threonine synthase-like 2 [Phallusia mammillata]
MKFRSTRGSDQLITFEETLLSAYGKDGGMWMAERVPEISLETLKDWKHLSYIEVVQKVVALHVSEDEIPYKEQEELLNRAYQKFNIKEVVKMAALTKQVQVMELFHGESMAFKDLAMCCVSEFLQYFLEKRKSFFTAFIATSGDTGGSAAYSVCGKPNIDVVVLYPQTFVSEIQAMMMTSIPDDNVHVYAVEGDMMDIDELMIEILYDKEFVANNNLGTMNSITFCRLMVQMAHHIWAYLQAAKVIGDYVDIVVPTGGAGNITACFLAQLSGVPIRAHAVTNINDCFHQIVTNNSVKLAKVKKTLAPAMDISFPGNFERVIWLASNQSGEIVSAAINTFLNGEEMHLPEFVHNKIQKYMQTAIIDQEGIKSAMLKCYSEHKYFVCPHTATALSYIFTRNLDKDYKNVVAMATAHPAKFPEILESVGLPPVPSTIVDGIRKQEKRCLKLEKDSNWRDLICKKIVDITAKHQANNKSLLCN